MFLSCAITRGPSDPVAGAGSGEDPVAGADPGEEEEMNIVSVINKGCQKCELISIRMSNKFIS